MFKNYLRVALRNLVKHRVHSIINVLGLSIGIAISILIMMLVLDEISYDRYHDDWEKIYRVNKLTNFEGQEQMSALTPLALKPAIQNEISQVRASTRILRGSHKLVRYGDLQFSAERFYYTDECFFSIFSIPLIRGDGENALSEPKTVVLTESTARQYFEDRDPLGRVLKLDNGWSFTVTGICEDVPENAHFHFDYLASLAGILEPYEPESWIYEMVATYIMIPDHQDKEVIKSQLDSFVLQYVIPQVDMYMGPAAATMTDEGEYRFRLQPLSEIHLNNAMVGEFETGTDKVYIHIFISVSLLILLIACVNFMNLATARSITRSREVAIRKIVGASRKQMINQFLSESVFFSFLALFLSLVVLELVIRPFSNFSGRQFDIFYLDYWYIIPSFILGALIIGIFSGSYPALYLSSFNVINILKGRGHEGMRSTRLRGALVFSQFTVSILLFISSMIIYQQMKFFREKNLGFNQNNIVVVQRAYALQDRKEDFKKILVEHPRINSASVSMVLPGTDMEQYPFHIENTGKDKVMYMRPMPADFDFLKTMQMYLVEGEYFSGIDSNGYNTILINETAARQLGNDVPVGMKLMGIGMMGEEAEYTVKGVVKDYHFESLHNEIKPMAITLLHDKQHPQYLSVRISGENMPETMEFIEKTWGKFANDEPFDYYFLNSALDAMYDQEKTTASIFTIFSFLAVFIAALGLLGLASHLAEQKTREIGIRKAMGASMSRIIMMLSARFTRWVLYANFLAFPLAYLSMRLWLGRFAYRVNIEAWLFFLAGILTICIALFTVSFQALRSARANPIEALQYE